MVTSTQTCCNFFLKKRIEERGVTHVSIRKLGLEVQGDQTLVGIEEENLLHGDPDAGEVVIPGCRVVVPNGDDKALPHKVIDANKLEGVIPDRVEGLVHSFGLDVVLLEPSLGMLLPEALLVVQEVHQGVGVLAPLSKDLVSGLDMNLKNAIRIANLEKIL